MKNNILLLGAWLMWHTAYAQTQIQDTDGNTRVQTEALPNEDKVRIVTNGTDRLYIGANSAGFTRIDVLNTNQCLFIGQGAGINSTAANNTGLGFRAGGQLTTGFSNTFVGQNAGLLTNTGSNNVALGSNALMVNAGGHSNVAIGTSSLSSMTSGSNNTAVGNSALTSNTASDNTALGSSALQNTTSGSGNTAVGRRAAQLNNTGSANSALGQEALRDNTSGDNNTAVGHLALSKNTTAGSNTALGRSALLNITTGGNNTALGANAGDLSTGNTNCTFLGFDTDNSLNGNMNNSTAIGSGARINASNKIRLGNTAVTVVEGAATYTTSDGRFKNEVKNDAPGLEFVLGLRPVTYHFDYTGFSRFLGENSVDHEVLAQKEQKREMGFVAQEVELLCQKHGIEVSNLVHTPENEADNYSLAYGQLVVPLVKAIQEQQMQLEAQQSEIEVLKKMLSQLLAQQPHSPVDITVWPNPTDAILNIRLKDAGPNCLLTLLSADGLTLRTQSARDGVQTMDTKQLPAGNYWLQVTTPGQQPVVRQVVKY
jgi:hypothetical protein